MKVTGTKTHGKPMEMSQIRTGNCFYMEGNGCPFIRIRGGNAGYGVGVNLWSGEQTSVTLGTYVYYAPQVTVNQEGN